MCSGQSGAVLQSCQIHLENMARQRKIPPQWILRLACENWWLIMSGLAKHLHKPDSSSKMLENWKGRNKEPGVTAALHQLRRSGLCHYLVPIANAPRSSGFTAMNEIRSWGVLCYSFLWVRGPHTSPSALYEMPMAAYIFKWLKKRNCNSISWHVKTIQNSNFSIRNKICVLSAATSTL